MPSPDLTTPCSGMLACIQLQALVIKSKVFTCFTPLRVNGFPYKLAPNEPNVPNDKMLRNSPFCAFPSFSIVLLMPFINKTHSSRDLTIFMISSFLHLKLLMLFALLSRKDACPNQKFYFEELNLLLMLLLLTIMVLKHF